MSNSNFDLMSRIKLFYSNNDIGYNSEMNFWRIGTSISSMIESFISDNKKCFYLNGQDDKGKYIVSSKKMPCSATTIHQSIRIGLIFNVFKFENNFKEFITKKNKDFINAWKTNKLVLEYNEDLKSYNNAAYWIIDKKEDIRKNWKMISNNYPNSFIYDDLRDIIFNISIYNLNYNGELNNQEIECYLSDHRKKKNFKEGNYFREYKLNKNLLDAFKILIK
ncbi:hypothetical protein [Spiroplasma endosymbiont of Aspidapion aeneum]|uniref:hypothetical protein n=1 Tax=Spiroplasma endosymbiont of Aspidapion aeneum TaxID=3066276 RepID=UPI00313D4801